MIRRAIWTILAMALLAGGCAGSESGADADDTEPDRPQASILPPAQGPDGFGDAEPEGGGPVESSDDGRLVVQSADGQLTTMLPDGSEDAELTDPGSTNSQPAWAPDGSRIAWVSIDDETGVVSLATDRFDRSDTRAMTLDAEPYYLYWDPSSARLAYLAATETGGSDLWVAEPLGEDGPTERRVDRGAPYYLSWGPDGDELLVHASGFRLDRIDLGSATLIVDEFPAAFGAAAWLPDDSLFFADLQDDEQFLVSTGASGEGRRPLATYDGSLRFTVSNSGNRIVMQAVPTDEEDPVVTASTDPTSGQAPIPALFQQPTPTPDFDDSLDQIDELRTNVPYVMGTFGGEAFPLSTQPAVALFPSPSGESIAWLERSIAAEDALQLYVEANGAIFTSDPFIPSDETSEHYLPRFDQYGLSHDFWSPSSTLFVYAGRPLGASGPDGIWIFDTTDGSTTRIADGVVASFTRTPDAGGAASAL